MEVGAREGVEVVGVVVMGAVVGVSETAGVVIDVAGVEVEVVEHPARTDMMIINSKARNTLPENIDL